jgi:hypothetical protein
MQNSFTVHCIPWNAGAPLLQEIRVAASEMGLMGKGDALTDNFDKQYRHALALSKNGRAIGCARITPNGQIDRIVALLLDQRSQIEAALTEILNDYAQQLRIAPIMQLN